MMQDILTETSTNGVVRITLNRPERRNALTIDMMNVIRSILLRAEDDPSIRLILFAGAGDRSFCAGADLSPGDTPFQPSFAQLNLPFADLLRAGMRSPVPIICAFNGDCVAGGMGFLGICDFALASKTSRFGMPEVKIGLFPMQIAAVLRDLIPQRLMADLSYTGRLLGAEEALASGLLTSVHNPAELDGAVEELIERLLAVSPMATRRGKYTLRSMAGMSFEQMIAFAETQVGPMIMTEDAREGLKAFNEKRKPVWPNG